MPGKFEQKKQQPPKRPKKKSKWKKYRRLLLYILVPLLCGCIFGAWMMSNLPGFDHIGDRL
jgi:hypothetical protein